MTGLEVALRPPPVAETVKPRSSVLFPKITLTHLIRSNYLRNLHGLVLAGRYFWVQNLGSSVREQSAVWNKEHKEVHSCTTQGDYISDGERVTVKTKVDRRKQLFLGRALMKVWRWTSRIGEVVSLTYSNHRHSQLSLQQIVIGNMTGLVFLPHNFFVVSRAFIERPQVKQHIYSTIPWQAKSVVLISFLQRESVKHI